MTTKLNKAYFVLLLISLYTISYYGHILIADPDSYNTYIISSIFSIVGALSACISLIISYIFSKDKAKILWFWFAIGLFSYVIAELIWMYYASILRIDIPFPGYTDLFYILHMVFYLIGLVHYSVSTKVTFRNYPMIIELLIVMVIACTLSYYFLLEDYIRNYHSDINFFLVSIVYPVGDLVLYLITVFLYLNRKENHLKYTISLVLLGIFLQVIADTFFSYFQLGSSYKNGDIIEPLFTFSLLIVGFSEIIGKNLPLSEKKTKVSFDFIRLVFPYFLSLLLILIIILYDRHHPILVIGGFITFSLILLRQVIMVKMNTRLLKRLQTSNQKFYSLFENHSDAAMSFDRNGKIIEVNKAFLQMAIDPIEIIIGQSFYTYFKGKETIIDYYFQLALKGDHQNFEIEYQHPINGQIIFFSITFIPMQVNSEVIGVFGISKDITEIVQSVEKIEYLAYHDSLTGLANRICFEEALQNELLNMDHKKLGLAVVLIDFDRFKIINDTLGHDAGDELLITIAKRLQSIARRDDVIARQGGDEFTFLLKNIQSKEEIVTIVNRLIDELTPPYFIQNHYFLTTPSIGISYCMEGKKSASTIMKQADIAMYYSKSNGKNQYNFFEENMSFSSENHMILENDLHQAIKKGEFVLYFQPQIDSLTNSIYGVEALIRWNHPKKGLLTPWNFIHIAEETNLILPIGEWIIREACKQGKLWHDKGINWTVSINISPKQFQFTNLANLISGVIAETGFNPNYLIIEITEAVAMRQLEETVEKLKEIKELGVKVSIDDFGTGHSSLSYLTDLPIDALKIPREFIQNLGLETNNAIISTIITLAKNLNLSLVAEGVESIEQLQILQEMGCYSIQGFLYSVPMKAESLENYSLELQNISIH